MIYIISSALCALIIYDRNIKKLLKEKKISEDETSNNEKDVQKSTDENISLI